MKKYSILMGALVVLSALVSCQKEAEVTVPEDNTVAKVPFVLKAQVPETKTTIDADTWQVAWENGDIVYAVTLDEEWGKPYSQDDPQIESIAEFVCADNAFTTTSTISDGEHTFNFLYTANASQKSFHRGAATSYSLYSGQSMDAAAPTAALKINDALAGQATVVTPANFVQVPMNHLFTLMKVTLKNKTANEVTVTKFEMKAADATLAGVFNVTFGETPSISLKSGGKDNITVDITNGTVAADGELPVYFVIAPLSNYSGEVSFTVFDDEGNTYTKTNTVSGVTFNAGEYNTATCSFKNADAVECVTLDWTYPESGAATSAGLNAIPGVTTSGLGGDYGTNQSPYCIKLDNTGDYIQVRTDQAIGSVSVKYKMIGGGNSSTLEIYESANGTTWTDVEDLSISGAQNSTGVLTTTATFDEASRFVKINFVKGSNIGLGGITILKKGAVSTYAVNIASDIENGTVTADKTKGITLGESITLTITPDAGYELETLTVDGENVTDDVYSSQYTFTMPAHDVAVDASFKARAAGEYILNGTEKVGDAAPYNAYAAYSDLTQDGITWNVMGNTTLTPWRIGGKSLTDVDRDIFSTNPLDFDVKKIEITHGSADNITVNSFTVIVASDDSFSTVVSTLTPEFTANATVTVNRPEGVSWNDCYFKFVYNVTVTDSKNKFLQFVSAKFSDK